MTEELLGIIVRLVLIGLTLSACFVVVLAIYGIYRATRALLKLINRLRRR